MRSIHNLPDILSESPDNDRRDPIFGTNPIPRRWGNPPSCRLASLSSPVSGCKSIHLPIGWNGVYCKIHWTDTPTRDPLGKNTPSLMCMSLCDHLGPDSHQHQPIGQAAEPPARSERREIATYYSQDAGTHAQLKWCKHRTLAEGDTWYCNTRLKTLAKIQLLVARDAGHRSTKRRNVG